MPWPAHRESDSSPHLYPPACHTTTSGAVLPIYHTAWTLHQVTFMSSGHWRKTFLIWWWHESQGAGAGGCKHWALILFPWELNRYILLGQISQSHWLFITWQNRSFCLFFWASMLKWYTPFNTLSVVTYWTPFMWVSTLLVSICFRWWRPCFHSTTSSVCWLCQQLQDVTCRPLHRFVWALI
jgi:hypothetical protein